MPPWQSARALFLVGVQHSDGGKCRCVPIADDKIGLWPAKRVTGSVLSARSPTESRLLWWWLPARSASPTANGDTAAIWTDLCSKNRYQRLAEFAQTIDGIRLSQSA